MLFTLYGASLGGVCAGVVLFAFPSSSLLILVPCVCLFGFCGFRVARMRVPEKAQWILLPLMPFAMVVAMFAMTAVVAAIALWITIAWPFLTIAHICEERRFRQRMQSQGRFATFRDLQARLESGSGTLIEEREAKDPCRIWWTEDDMEEAPATREELVAVFQDEHKWSENRRRFQTYLDERTGKALLTPIPARQARSGRLARRFPRARRVVIVRPSIPEIAEPPAADQPKRP